MRERERESLCTHPPKNDRGWVGTDAHIPTLMTTRQPSPQMRRLCPSTDTIPVRNASIGCAFGVAGSLQSHPSARLTMGRRRRKTTPTTSARTHAATTVKRLSERIKAARSNIAQLLNELRRAHAVLREGSSRGHRHKR